MRRGHSSPRLGALPRRRRRPGARSAAGRRRPRDGRDVAREPSAPRGPAGTAADADDDRRRGVAHHDHHRRAGHDPVARRLRGGQTPGRSHRALRGCGVVRGPHGHERHGYGAGRRRARPDPLGRTPGTPDPRVDLCRRARPRSRHGQAARRGRRLRTAAHGPSRNGRAGDRGGPARRRPAEGPDGRGRRDAPRAQHAALDGARRCTGRFADPVRSRARSTAARMAARPPRRTGRRRSHRSRRRTRGTDRATRRGPLYSTCPVRGYAGRARHSS